MDPYAYLMEIWPLLPDEKKQELVEIAAILAQYAPKEPPQDTNGEEEDS